ncbi:MAG TPA: hypothetical protein VMM78_10595 [Thermomicrobiales bacterium]|nr:hypothetical protein [Thermomicrobiales bacterium]
MERRTIAHLHTAERNRAVAHRLVLQDDEQDRSPEWCAVVAFYSAVHLVSTYLWERLLIEPRDHLERGRLVALTSDLKSCRGSYQRLRDIGFQARYVPEFRISGDAATDLLASDLAAVESAVRSTLDED